MAIQELMLNDNVNLNFKYNNRIFKLKVNLRNGLLLLGDMKENSENFNLLQVTNLDTIQSKSYEVTATRPKEELIEDSKGEEETNGRSGKHQRRKSQKNKKKI